MDTKKKLLGEERRLQLLHILQSSDRPITGSELSKQANVSRQVIVSDITLLKARNEPIIATSQGYLYMHTANKTQNYERTVACHHEPSRTEEELNLLVDIGVTVKNVSIEHPIYGDLTASIMVSSRKDVQQFLTKMSETNASYLLELTDGIHLHTLSASSEELLDEAEAVLKKANILVE
ncbi:MULTISPECIES: transcription repressor NadR [Peribacillus]|uniref:Transcriptional regulator n=1 Tax=Peribacillus asahii TaxID=228899 RepID=A0A3T0KW58_9BACI|nr:transcription repressor NadR [Peribacillus asahii]AZV44560.1 transcriptional regulator [Peribacillus asahii]USK84235.1 transcription repressor NadR [Peribacillus asahii]